MLEITTVEIEKADNGYVICVNYEGDDDFSEKKLIATNWSDVISALSKISERIPSDPEY